MSKKEKLPIGQGKYDYLAALNVGESVTFDNLPTAQDAKLAMPSQRRAYTRISAALHAVLNKRFPDHEFVMTVHTTSGSRIKGDKIRVTLVRRGEEWVDDRRLVSAYKRNKERAKQGSITRKARRRNYLEARSAHLKQNAIQAEAGSQPIYDPKRLAELVLANSRGEQIQFFKEGKWYDAMYTPDWSLPTAHLRVRPNRREFFIIVGRNGDVTAAATDLAKLPHHDPACLVHAVEVSEEDQ